MSHIARRTYKAAVIITLSTSKSGYFISEEEELEAVGLLEMKINELSSFYISRDVRGMVRLHIGGEVKND